MYWKTQSHADFVWTNDSPPALQLPGARIRSTIGSFGRICTQELLQGDYGILLNILAISKKFTGQFYPPPETLHTRVMLKGRENRSPTDGLPWILRPHQLTTMVAGRAEEITFERDVHISLDIFFQRGMLREITPAFPFVNQLLTAPTPSWIQPQWADPHTLDAVQSILQCPHQDQQRRNYYFNNRVRDLLLNILVRSQSATEASPSISEQEIRAVQEARNIIVNNLADHLTIRELARVVLLNECQLKLAFKTVYGVGPYRFRVAARMKKARELLLQGLSIKEVADRIGYRPSVFTTSFREFFGYPPSSVRKTN